MKIGIVINHSENSETKTIATYAQMREMAQAAEASGLDSIWLFDHLLFRFGEGKGTEGIWECWTMLSALAEATERVELGTLVLCNPFRNPALLAKMAHTLDEVSNGRLILGIGAGWHQPEFDAFGYSFEKRVDRFEEALQIISPLIKGQTVDFDGRHYQAQDCVIAPLGPRPEGMPLLVGSGRPRMLRLTAQYADQWNTAWLNDPAELAERLARLHAACEEVGRDPATMTITVGTEMAFSDLGKTYPMTKTPHAGSAEEIAQTLQGYADAGTDHLIIMVSQSELSAIERIGKAAQLFRQ